MENAWTRSLDMRKLPPRYATNGPGLDRHPRPLLLPFDALRSMRAIQIEKFGGYENLRLVELPAPKREADQVLVRMRIAPVTPLDDTIRRGHLPAAATKPLPLIPGGGGVAEVVDPGPSDLAAGALVLVTGWGYGMRLDGTWRELVALPVDHFLPIPAGLAPESVAALQSGVGY